MIEPGYDELSQSYSRSYVITSYARLCPREEDIRQDAPYLGPLSPHSKIAVDGMGLIQSCCAPRVSENIGWSKENIKNDEFLETTTNDENQK